VEANRGVLSNRDEEWLRRMAEAEDEALAGCNGVLACSPELWAMMNGKEVVMDVPREVRSKIHGLTRPVNSGILEE